MSVVSGDETCRILIVDDEEAVRYLLVRILTRAGHDTIDVGSARLTLEELERSAIDIVLTDVRMPGEDGLELAAKVKHTHPDTDIIVMTAYAGIDVAADEMILVSVSSILHMAQTHLVFRCHLKHRPDTISTEEAVESAWFEEHDLPWEDLAFASIEPHVRQVYGWLKEGNYGIRVGFIDQSGSQYRNFPLAKVT